MTGKIFLLLQTHTFHRFGRGGARDRRPLERPTSTLPLEIRFLEKRHRKTPVTDCFRGGQNERHTGNSDA
jgi:hypothetical protein